MLNKLNKIIDESINNEVISAIAIEIEKKGENIFSYHNGYNYFAKNADTYNIKHSKINNSFIFDLASLTKVISGFTMVADLISKNIINLDTQIGEIFSENAIYINKELAKLNISSLLNHSSGLPAYIPLYNFCTNKSSIYSYIRNLKLDYPTGSKHVYSDIAYILLGEIIELYNESKLNDIFQNTVIKNFNLKDIGYVLANSACPRSEDLFISTGYSTLRKKKTVAEVNDENTFIMNGESLHAGLFASSTEVSNYGKTILNILNSREDNSILKKNILENLITKHTNSPWVNAWHYPSKDSSAGSYLSENSIGITGFTGTSLWLDIEKDISITILANRTISNNSAKFGGEKDEFSILRPKLHDIILRDL